jgi:hypothetical protein
VASAGRPRPRRGYAPGAAEETTHKRGLITRRSAITTGTLTDAITLRDPSLGVDPDRGARVRCRTQEYCVAMAAAVKAVGVIKLIE